MKLVMLGYVGFGNAGDEALLAAEVAALRSRLGTNTEFVAISNDPDHTQVEHGLRAVPRTAFGSILRELRSADALIAGGGSLLQDVTSARPVAFYGGVMLAARALGRPVFAYAHGLGPLRRPANRRLAGLALRASTYVSMRDAASVALAADLGVHGVELVPDPVLGMPAPAPEAGAGVEAGVEVAPRRLDVPRVAVALRPWHGQSRWLPSVTKALTALAADVELVLVPFHASQDVAVTREMGALVGAGGSEVSVQGGYRAAVDAVASADVVLGMRLHALVAAAAAQRPFVALSYDPKVAAFAELVDQPVAAELPGPVDAAAVETAVRTALRQRESDAYASTVADLRARACRPSQVVAERLGVR